MCDDTSSGLHWQATLMVFTALALPTALVVGSEGPQYWMTGAETGLVVGAVGAGVFYFVTGGNLIGSVVGDAASIFETAVCAILNGL